MRAIWSGVLSFGLVFIPVRLYSGARDRAFSFKYLRKTDRCPIKYLRVCRLDGREVPYEEIAKGYEYKKGDFILMKDEDFEKASVKKTKTIEIVDFVETDKIDQRFFVKPYFLEPEKEAQKAYVLLREALKKTGKTGIAKFVLRASENLAAIQAKGNAIILNQMRFSEEILKPEGIDLPSQAQYSPKEIDIAIQLINHLAASFDPEKYRDTYRLELMRIIGEKAKGRPVEAKEVAPAPTEVNDIMAKLRESLEKAKTKK
jgi:DNA end-binding protein Ku